MPKAYAGVRATDRSMPSTKLSALVTAVRVAFVIAGVGVAATTVVWLAQMPPPRGDGFATGMAAILGGLLIVASLGVAAVSVALPSVLGLDDPLGFGRYQRPALKAAGVLLVGGLVVGLTLGYLGRLAEGLVLLVLCVVLAAVVAAATLAWRVAELAVERFQTRRAGTP